MITNDNERLFTKALSTEEFDKYFDTIMERTRKVLKVKAREYARNEDRLHNFNSAALKKQISRNEVLDGMRLKHEISIDDMRKDIAKGILPSVELVSEKLGDRLNYDILEEISIMHEVEWQK